MDAVEVGKEMHWLLTKASLKKKKKKKSKKKGVGKEMSKGGTQVQAEHKINSSMEAA